MASVVDTQDQVGDGSNQSMDINNLSNAEKTSELYLQNLSQRITELRNQMVGEDLESAKLDSVICGLEGKANAYAQREESLGLLVLRETLEQAKTEFKASKDECGVITQKILEGGTELVKDIQKQSTEIEYMRLQYTVKSTVDNLLENSIKDSEASVEKCASEKEVVCNLESSIHELQKDLESFSGIDNILKQNTAEIAVQDAQIKEVSTRLQRMQNIFN